MRNEAKFGRDRVSGQRAILHDETFAGKWNVRNEPNFGADFRCKVSGVERVVRNEPNSARSGQGRFPRQAKDAKRTQFPAMPGGPRPQGRGTRGECAKRTQFAVCHAGAGGTNRAKRSQFPAGPGGTAPQGRGTRGQMCKTKPISSDVRRDEAARARNEGQTCKTKPNFRPDSNGQGPGRPPVPPAGPVVQTKPIPVLRADAREVETALVCGTYPRGATTGNPLPAGCRCL